MRQPRCGRKTREFATERRVGDRPCKHAAAHYVNLRRGRWRLKAPPKRLAADSEFAPRRHQQITEQQPGDDRDQQ